MNFVDLGIPGAFIVEPRVLTDPRGTFVKTFAEATFAARGLPTDWREEFHSSSRRGVVRGMHFQTPPADHAKLVFCIAGAVHDVVLDLRRGSPTFGQHRSVELDARHGTGLFIPRGCAHGFVSTSDWSTMYYKVTSAHSPEHDRGIAWDSFGHDWSIANPVLSDRDRTHPPLSDFDSPFTMTGTAK